MNHLQQLVEQLRAEVKELRANAVNNAPVSSVDRTSADQYMNQSNVVVDQRETTQEVVLLTAQQGTHVSALPEQCNIVYTSQSLMSPIVQQGGAENSCTAQKYEYNAQPAVSIANCHLFTPVSIQPVVMSTVQTNITPRFAPMQHNCLYTNRSGVTTANQMRQNVQQPYSPRGTMQSVSQLHSLKDVSPIIPFFDPADDNYTSIQFIERIEQLKNVYEWDDAVLTFAVLSKVYQNDGLMRNQCLEIGVILLPHFYLILLM